MPLDCASYRSRLAETLADSLGGPIPEGTPRHVHGPVALPGKATAVVGMRRSGKTAFPTRSGASGSRAEWRLIELERRGMTVTYLRTPEGHEVDFLARSPAGETELAQPAYEWILS